MIAQFFAWLVIAGMLCLPALLATPLFDTCTIFSDSFAANDIASYDQRSGSWSIGGGVLTTTSSSSLIVATTAGATGHGRVTCDVKASTTASTLRIIGAYVDDDNYLFAEATVNGASSTLTLWKRDTAVETQIDRGACNSCTLNTGTSYTVELCWDGSRAATSISGGVRSPVLATYTGTGNQAGLGGTPASSGTNTFDNFSFSKSHSDDATCTACGASTCNICPQCFDAPANMQMVVSGLANNTCTHCATYDGTYVLPYVGTSSVCRWLLFSSAGLCNTTGGQPSFSIQLDTVSSKVALAPSSSYVQVDCAIVAVGLYQNSDLGIGDSPADCKTISGAVGTFFSAVSTCCDASASTITITAL